MINLWGRQQQFCDKISRRNFLQAGGLGLSGLALGDILRLRATAGDKPTKPRSVIMICLPGGPSHMDMYDLKPEAPSDYRGDFQQIHTNVPGFDICEHMPLQATIADKLSLVRTVQFVEPMQHELEEVYTGFPKAAKRPTMGSIVSRFLGGHSTLPPYVSLDYVNGVPSFERPLYAGAAHGPLHVSAGEGLKNLGMVSGITPVRFDDRRGLLRSFDASCRNLDACADSLNLDAFTQRAFDIISSPKAREAFDLTRESDATRARYAVGAKYAYVGPNADIHWEGQSFLQARRLVEAGVPVVTLRAGSWDQHGVVLQSNGSKSIWHSMKTSVPLLDRSLHALVTDLHERGLDKEVLVLVWGEFGRTPRINLTGRDHWPDVGFALFAGAVAGGQVIGQTDSRGERPKTRAVTAQNIIGTVYRALGIDYRQKLNDFNGRPMQLLDDGEPIPELIA